jgi:glycosyltransferase involved in cell wall biosynthesis
MPAAPAVSFAIPCYNERDNLEALVAAIETEADRLALDYEIVITDDCSTDGSWELLQRLLPAHPRLRIQRLSKNSGESAASFAAIRGARGDVIVTLDADLQNDPRELPKFLAAIREADCVCGTRKATRREGDSWLKTVTSRVANFIRSRFLDDPITDAGCTYRAFRRECVADLPVFKGVHRFLPILIGMRGYRVVEVPVVNQPRAAGKSKYTLLNRAGAVIDMFGVRWLKGRMRHGTVDERLPRD